jgi:hypothetical protein
MNRNIVILTVAIFAALLFCGSAAATNVTSTNTTNFMANKMVSVTPHPDLVVKNITVSATGVKGYPITVANTIKNQGNKASGGFYVNYYLKTNASSTSIYIGKRYITS